VYAISLCICKLCKYATNTHKARPMGVCHTPVVVCFVAYVSSLQIHQEMVYTSHFLISSTPKSAVVYIYIYGYISMNRNGLRRLIGDFNYVLMAARRFVRSWNELP